MTIPTLKVEVGPTSTISTVPAWEPDRDALLDEMLSTQPDFTIAEAGTACVRRNNRHFMVIVVPCVSEVTP